MPVVQVTREDIDKAIRASSTKCAVAEAVKRTFPDASRVAVDLQSIRATQGGKRMVWMTPRRVQEYIVAFDYGDTDIPEFKVTLRNPQITVTNHAKAKAEGTKLPKRSISYSSDTPPVHEAPKREGGPTPPTAQGFGSVRNFGVRGLRGNRQTPTNGD